MTMKKGRDFKEYHGKNRLDCDCPKCTGEAAYERNEARKIKVWDEANIQW